MDNQEAIRWLDLIKIALEHEATPDCQIAIDKAIEALKQPEIIRCGECVHWQQDPDRRNRYPKALCVRTAWKEADWFCADAEKKEG